MLLLELVLMLLLCAVALGWVARHFKFPYPIALVAGGAVLSFIPNLPRFPFDPQLILVLWGLFITAVAVALRFVWVYPATHLPRLLSRKERENAPPEWADPLRAEITDRILLAAPEGADFTPKAELLARLRHAAIKAERRELIRLWRANEISDEVMHHLEEILDYQEAHL